MTDAELDALDRLCQNLLEGMKPFGCTDGYCFLRGHATGMHTNGGCHCLNRRTLEPRLGNLLGHGINTLRTAFPQLVAEVRQWRERTYERRCVGCAFARVEIVPKGVDPREADTYCGNEDSPCRDRSVSFFGGDTCGHWVKGTPVHETPAQRRGEA